MKMRLLAENSCVRGIWETLVENCMNCAKELARGSLSVLFLSIVLKAVSVVGDDASVPASNKTVKVAAIQAATRVGLISYNRKLLASLIVKAAKNGAKIVVTPECALQGYMDVGGDVVWAANAVSEDNELPVEKGAATLKDPSIKYFQGLAKKLKIYICLGFIEKALESREKGATEGASSAAEKGARDEKNDAKNAAKVWKYYNAQILIAPNGKIIAHHRKWNLWPPGDGGWASQGKLEPQVVDTEYGRIGLMICFDLHVLTPILAKQKADIVLFSVGWLGPNEENWFHNVFPRDYVKPYGFSLVLANWSAEELAEPWPGAGYSSVYDGTGKVLAKAKGVKGSEIVYAEIKAHPIPFGKNDSSPK